MGLMGGCVGVNCGGGGDGAEDFSFGRFCEPLWYPAMGGEPDLWIWHLKTHPSPLSITPWTGGGNQEDTLVLKLVRRPYPVAFNHSYHNCGCLSMRALRYPSCGPQYAWDTGEL